MFDNPLKTNNLNQQQLEAPLSPRRRKLFALAVSDFIKCQNNCALVQTSSSLSQFEFLDFSRRRFGKFLELHTLGRFESGQTLSDK